MTNNSSNAGAQRGGASVTFASRSPNFTLFLDKGRPVPGPTGQIEYKDRVTIRFQRHRYSTNDPDVIAAMRRCKSYKTQFQEVNEAAPTRGKAAAAAAEKTSAA